MPSPEIAGAHKPVRARASARHPPPPGGGGGGGCARVRCQRAQRRKRVLAPRLGPRERARAHQRSLSSASEERARVGVGTQRASERVSASACACTGARAAGGAKKWLEFPPIRAKKKKQEPAETGRARAWALGVRARLLAGSGSRRRVLVPQNCLPLAREHGGKGWEGRLGDEEPLFPPPLPVPRARATEALQKFPPSPETKRNTQRNQAAGGLPGARHRTAHSPWPPRPALPFASSRAVLGEGWRMRARAAPSPRTDCHAQLRR